MSELIPEFALTPDAFDSGCYSNPAAFDSYLQNLKKALLEEGLVRNLRDGGWERHIEDNRERWGGRAKELFKKLKVQGRLCTAPPEAAEEPEDDVSWCNEALRSHVTAELCGVIASHQIKQQFPEERTVASIEKLDSTSWWQGRVSSIVVKRTYEDYIRALDVIVRQANSLMFIDRYLDPTKRNYRGFPEILRCVFESGRRPLIELHRVVYEGSGPGRRVLEISEWRRRFEDSLGSLLRHYEAEIEIVIWSDFHDRYLISDVVGLFLGNGFDVDHSCCRWSRLGRKERDEQQREFDPAVNGRNLTGKFVIPHSGPTGGKH